MMTCFKEAPEQRPTFESLKFQLEDYFFGTSERPYQGIKLCAPPHTKAHV